MKTSTLLRRAKRHLWNGTTDLYRDYRRIPICLAIAEADPYLRYYEDIPVCQEIHKRLEGYSTLENWLRSRGIAITDDDDVLIQRHRKQWLDMLIAEYQMKGD